MPHLRPRAAGHLDRPARLAAAAGAALVALVLLASCAASDTTGTLPKPSPGPTTRATSTTTTAALTPVGTITGLGVTSSLLGQLRSAYLVTHAPLTAEQVTIGRGGAYAAIDGTTQTGWALARMLAPTTGGADQPEAFVRPAGSTTWIDLGGTAGDLCKIPRPVLLAWDHVHHTMLAGASSGTC